MTRLCKRHASDHELANARQQDVVSCGTWCKEPRYDANVKDLQERADASKVASPNRTSSEERVAFLEGLIADLCKAAK